ncbi:MAG: DUF4290 domain-containing protein [Paraprevotella sp.]|nr:DUF4290 domain-containing protein [Paraprevotella sp.]
MEYNTQRKRLPMPEYGRGIQNMVDYALTIENRDERQRCANTIVSIMGNMFPQFREVPDFKHKLWDHLAVMSDYKLDIDYPYEIEKKDSWGKKPQPMVYPMQRIRYRHYGYLLETLLKKLKDMPEGEERDALLQIVADQMKRSLVNWNKDGMDDAKIAADIALYTDGKVMLDLDKFRFSSLQGKSQQTLAMASRQIRRGGKKK